ncbi:hypothetical protein CaCOL14_003229 [Colletotrichum acutatum]
MGNAPSHCRSYADSACFISTSSYPSLAPLSLGVPSTSRLSKSFFSLFSEGGRRRHDWW